MTEFVQLVKFSGGKAKKLNPRAWVLSQSRGFSFLNENEGNFAFLSLAGLAATYSSAS
jgi:hypothetical protein